MYSMCSLWQSAQKIFGGEIKQHLLYFLKKSDEGLQNTLDEYKKAAQDFKGKVRNRGILLYPREVYLL